LKLSIKICLVKNGYPPQYSPEVFSKVMDQVENFEENSIDKNFDKRKQYYGHNNSEGMLMVAENKIPYGDRS